MNELQTKDWGIDKDRQEVLKDAFNPYMATIRKHIDSAKVIVILDETDCEGMKQARETRLELKRIRVDVERRRKSLKKNVVLEGKAIDGMANIIKYLIEPVEASLQEKEDFVRLAEERRMKELGEKREAALAEFDVDCTHIDLGAMAEEAFGSLLASSRAGHIAKKEAEAAELKRQADEAEARAKEEADRQAKQREELEKVKRDNAKIQKRLDDEKKAKDKAEADAKKAEAEATAERKKRIAAEEETKELQAQITCPECGHEFTPETTNA